MKRSLSLGFVLLVCSVLHAQYPSLQLSTEKTVCLLFPFPVVHVDRGTSNILVEGVNGATHILLLKAATKAFPETNLSVVTKDGSLYSFQVGYADTINTCVFQLHEQKGLSVEKVAHCLLDNPPIATGMKTKNGGITAQVTGIYIHGAHLFFQLRLQNDSPLDYEVDFLRTFLRDKKRSKRTAIQEVEYTPLVIAGNYTRVESFGEKNIVIALEKFTISKGKEAILQVGEIGGNRHLQVAVPGRRLLKGKLLQNY